MLLRETLGISADGSEKVYRDDDITAFEEREAQRLVWVDRDHRYTRSTTRPESRNCANSDSRVLLGRLNVMHFFVAVDPSGGGASAFSICSALTMPNGAIQVRCFLFTRTRPLPPPSFPACKNSRRSTWRSCSRTARRTRRGAARVGRGKSAPRAAGRAAGDRR